MNAHLVTVEVGCWTEENGQWYCNHCPLNECPSNRESEFEVECSYEGSCLDRLEEDGCTTCPVWED